MHHIILGILPAPNDVHYTADLPGCLQILWEPPTLDSDKLDLQNISIKRDARIIRYAIHITTEIVQVYNASGTSFAIGIDKIPCSFWFQVAAVNPAGVGERSPPQNLTFDCEFACMRIIVIVPIIMHNNNYVYIAHRGCMDSTHLTTVIETLPVSNGPGLSGE